MTRGKRIGAVLLCIVFVLTVVICSAFLATHLSHIHTGCRCQTCAAIHTAGELLAGCRQTASFSLLILTMLVGCALLFLREQRIQKCGDTLCSLKVMLTQ